MNRSAIGRLARYVGIGLLGIAVLPTVATAADQAKDVIVANTTAAPVPVKGVGTFQVGGSVAVSNLPAVQNVTGSVEVSNFPGGEELRHGDGYAINNGATDTVLPNDIVLTDLVVTYLGGQATLCEAALAETTTGQQAKGVLWFYPGVDDRTVQFHFESGLERTSDSWSVATNSQCTLRVFWSGYTA